jgi:chromosome segregation ATPase
MSQISLLDDKMKNIQRTLQQLEQERAVHLDKLQGLKIEQEALRQEELKAQAELDEIAAKLEDLYELKKETDVYYKQIQQSVETLLSLLSTPTAR